MFKAATEIFVTEIWNKWRSKPQNVLSKKKVANHWFCLLWHSLYVCISYLTAILHSTANLMDRSLLSRRLHKLCSKAIRMTYDLQFEYISGFDERTTYRTNKKYSIWQTFIWITKLDWDTFKNRRLLVMYRSWQW